MNLCKHNFHWTSIHLRNFTNVAQNGGFCSQDCASLLQQFGDLRELNFGKTVHSIAIKTRLDEDIYIQNNLIRFYAVLGDIISAQNVFDKISEPNLVSWTSMISSYVHDDQYEMGLSMFSRMCRFGLRPNEFGFSIALKACRLVQDAVMGELLHGLIIKSGFLLCSYCSSSILGLYVELDDMKNACKFSDEIPFWERSEALWNMLLEGYAKNCDMEEVFKLFRSMVSFSSRPNGSTFTILIKLCGNYFNYYQVRLLHCCIVKVGFEDNAIVGAALVDTYGKLGLLSEACNVFQDLTDKDNVAWSALLTGFLQNGAAEHGLRFYLKFVSEGNKPDPFTFASVFSLSSDSDIEGIGRQLHCSFIKYGFVFDSFSGSALIDMYGNSGMISDAHRCFLEVQNKNEICFSAMINNLVSSSNNEKALELLSEMRKLGVAPSQSTFSYILRACAGLQMLREGKALHSYVVKNFTDLESNLCLENSLIEMYAKCGLVEKAKTVFEGMRVPNEFTWTTIISGYSESGKYKEALELFNDMLASPVNAKPNHFTVIPVIQACAELKALDGGKQVHCCAIKSGFDHYPFVGSALINMYASFKHETDDAFLVFSSMNQHDIVSWSAMLTAWSRNGFYKEALTLFAKFQNAPSFSIDEPIVSSCLSACAGLTSLDMGKWFHSAVIRTGLESHVHIASSIIDMYSKCGSIKDACKFFERMRDHNLVCWTAMISGYASNGLGREAIELFNEMEKAGLEPDGVTFIGILSACSHSGLLEEGWRYFESMKIDYGLEVTIYHYACMVDLLGRFEYVDEAVSLINKAPFLSKTLLWKILLGACNTHSNVEMGNRIAHMLIELEPHEPSNYVLLSNIYAAASMWDGKIEIRNKMKQEHFSKQPGQSWIQMSG